MRISSSDNPDPCDGACVHAPRRWPRMTQRGPANRPQARRRRRSAAERLKTDAVKDVDSMKVFTQQMVDSIFSFAELGFQETETNRYLIDILKKNGFTRAGRHRRHSHRVHGDVGIGQAGHRARVGHRRHPAGVAEARRRVSRADDRRRARPRRRPQLRTGRERHGRARGEEDHGAREAAGHDPHLARHRRGARRARRRTSCARASSRTSTSRSSRTSTTSLPCRGATATGPGSSRSNTPSRARPRIRRARRGAAAARSTPSS